MKSTKARESILDILSNSDKPLSYEQMRQDIQMDKATFYRNIAKFEKKGLVDKIQSEEKRWYFELKKAPHAHFICNNCLKIECIENMNLTLEHYLVQSVILKGVCKKCLN